MLSDISMVIMTTTMLMNTGFLGFGLSGRKCPERGQLLPKSRRDTSYGRTVVLHHRTGSSLGLLQRALLRRSVCHKYFHCCRLLPFRLSMRKLTIMFIRRECIHMPRGQYKKPIAKRTAHRSCLVDLVHCQHCFLRHMG